MNDCVSIGRSTKKLRMRQVRSVKNEKVEGGCRVKDCAASTLTSGVHSTFRPQRGKERGRERKKEKEGAMECREESLARRVLYTGRHCLSTWARTKIGRDQAGTSLIRSAMLDASTYTRVKASPPSRCYGAVETWRG